MMPFTIAATVGVITIAIAEFNGFRTETLTSTAPGPNKTQVTAVAEANPNIDALVEKKVVATPIKPDAPEIIAKVNMEIPPAVVVAPNDGVPEYPDPTACFGMKYGTIDCMEPNPTARFELKHGMDDGNSIDTLVKMMVATPVKRDGSEAVTKVDAEIAPVAVATANEGVPQYPDPTICFDLKYGTIDCMKPNPTAGFDMKFGTDDENSTDWIK